MTHVAVRQGTRLFISVGHDEYWSGPQRAAVEAARDAGTHLAFFSGNEVYCAFPLVIGNCDCGTSCRFL